MSVSDFWQQLAQEHARSLESHGFDQVKRHQALRYFTWQWRWRSLRQSEQMRFLLSHSSPGDLLRSAFAPIELSDEAWEGVSWTRADRWLYAYATRLLWQYARKHDAAGVVALPEPTLGTPLPVRLDGRLISQDLANSALEVDFLVRALAGAPIRSVLEVGAGYGRTAYVILSLFPDVTYTIVDIEPAISISRWYLTQLFPAARLRFVRPDEIATIEPVDLALSISSLQEITHAQLEEYLKLFDRVAAWVYLKQWIAWYNPVDRITMRFDDYPIPGSWQLAARGVAPVQTKFVQAVWRTHKDSIDSSAGVRR